MRIKDIIDSLKVNDNVEFNLYYDSVNKLNTKGIIKSIEKTGIYVADSFLNQYMFVNNDWIILQAKVNNCYVKKNNKAYNESKDDKKSIDELAQEINDMISDYSNSHKVLDKDNYSRSYIVLKNKKKVLIPKFELDRLLYNLKESTSPYLYVEQYIFDSIIKLERDNDNYYIEDKDRGLLVHKLDLNNFIDKIHKESKINKKEVKTIFIKVKGLK